MKGYNQLIVNKKLLTFMNVHQRVHELFLNVPEQQMNCQPEVPSIMFMKLKMFMNDQDSGCSIINQISQQHLN